MILKLKELDNCTDILKYKSKNLNKHFVGSDTYRLLDGSKTCEKFHRDYNKVSLSTNRGEITLTWEDDNLLIDLKYYDSIKSFNYNLDDVIINVSRFLDIMKLEIDKIGITEGMLSKSILDLIEDMKNRNIQIYL